MKKPWWARQAPGQWLVGLHMYMYMWVHNVSYTQRGKNHGLTTLKHDMPTDNKPCSPYSLVYTPFPLLCVHSAQYTPHYHVLASFTIITEL